MSGDLDWPVHSCLIDWPSPTYVPSTPPAVPAHTHYHFTPAAQRLSDEDVERIAKRVAELLKVAPGG